MMYLLSTSKFGEVSKEKEFTKIIFSTKSKHVYIFERINGQTYLVENGYYPIEGLSFHTHKTKYIEDSIHFIDNFELVPSICFWGKAIVSRITSKIEKIDVTFVDNTSNSYSLSMMVPNDLEKSLLERGFFGNPGKAFLQSNGKTINTMPQQGIKLHISVRDYVDYVATLRKIVPVLQKYGVTFKVVKPTSFSNFLEGHSKQQGKFITIYPCKCNFKLVIEELINVLNDSEGVIPVIGDVHIGGRIFGRYGSMMGPYVYDQLGNAYKDDRSKAYPSFIRGISIQDFINSVA